jgi:DNA-binding MarR family transcriptional regulator
MDDDAGGTRTSVRPASGEQGTGDDALLRLFRYSHIFSSVVREFLDVSVLREATTLPLSVPQFHLLKLIALSGLHQVGEAADVLGVSAPAATKNIDKLERLGLVVRGPPVGDRRATPLTASAKGRHLVRRYEELKSARVAPILSGYPPETIRGLTTLLEQFSVSLLGLERSHDGFCLRCAAYVEEGCAVGVARGGCPYQLTREARAVHGPSART